MASLRGRTGRPAPFTIDQSAPPASIQITEPFESGTLEAGGFTTIGWTANGLSGALEVQLIPSAGSPISLGWAIASDGIFNWYVCEYLGNLVVARIQLRGYSEC